MYTIVKCSDNKYNINALKDERIQKYFLWLPPSTTSRVMSVGPEWEGETIRESNMYQYKNSVQVQYVPLVGA